VKPAASAAFTAAMSREGDNCSWDAWNPTVGTLGSYP
jgi:hypothetical protein